MTKKAIIALLTILCSCGNLLSQQQAYFVDGYHGGIYGHYPMWVTQFMVDKLTQHPEWRIGLEIEPETWDTVSVKEPVAYDNFKNIVTDKRIEFTNPTYAQPYCYNISGESLIRQFHYGIKKIHQHFPDVVFTTYSAEEPCFTSCLPQLLKLFGFRYAVLKCPDTLWGGYTAAYGGELVNWIGPDGTSMLTVPRYACEEFENNSTWQTKAWNNSDSYLKACFDYGIKNPVGMCYQDAGWRNGPWIGNGKSIKNNSKYVTWKEYIENISVGKTDDDYHFSQEEMRVNLMWGSQVLQRIAQEVRLSENKIVMAEKIAALANVDNQYVPSQEKLDDGWRTLMMAQHHDSWIVPYNGLKKGKTWAQEITLWTNNTISQAVDIAGGALTSYISDGDASGNNMGNTRVFNTLGIKRSEVLEMIITGMNKEVSIYNSLNREVPSYSQQQGDSIRLFFLAEVPSFGYSTFTIKEKSPARDENIDIRFDDKGECILENDVYKMIIDPSRGGVIKSLISKKENNKEYADRTSKFSMNELRGHFYDEGKCHSTADSPARVTIIEDNHLIKKIQIDGQIASHPFTQIITLTKGQRRIDFHLTVDWKHNVGIGEYKQGGNWRENRRAFTDDRFKLNVMFPVDLPSAKLYKNAPFDVCESKLDNTFFNKWDNIKHNVILNWVDLVQENQEYGFALFTDHTTSYSYGEDFPLSLTAQYSGVGLWGPDYKITGPLKMRYAILPHTGKWDKAAVSAESNKWNEPLAQVSLNKGVFPMTDKSLIDTHNSGYEITAATVQGNDILIRLFNAEGDNSKGKITFGFPVSGVEEIDLNGNTIATIKPDKEAISLSMPRFGIKTLLVKRLTK